MWVDIESLSTFLCLWYCRSLNDKISASAFGGQLYCDTTMNFARVAITKKIDGTLETEYSRQSEFKTANEKWSKRLEVFYAQSAYHTYYAIRKVGGAQEPILHNNILARRSWQAVSWYRSWSSMINKQSHEFSSNLGYNCTRSSKNHTRLRLVQFDYC